MAEEEKDGQFRGCNIFSEDAAEQTEVNARGLEGQDKRKSDVRWG